MSLFLFQHPFAGSQRAPQGLRGSSRRRGARALTLLILLVMPALWLGAQPTSTVEMAPRSVTRLSDWWQAAQAEKPAPIAMDVVADVIFVDPHWKNLWVLEPSGIGSYIAIAGEIPPLRVGHRLRLHGIFTPTTRLSTENIHISVLEERAPPAPTSISGDVMNVGRFQYLRVRIAGVVESQRNVDPTHVELQLLSEGHRLPVTVLIGPSDLVPALTGAAITADGLYAPTYDDKGRPSGVALWAQDFRSIQVKGWLASDPRLELPLRNLSELDPTLNARWVRVTGEIADARPGESFTLVDGEHRLTARTGQQVLPAVGTSAMVIGRLATDGGSVLLHEALIPAAITSQTANRPPEVLRNLGQWWAATTAGRREPLPLDTVAEVLFYDRSYRNLWINNAEGGYYIAVGDRPLDLRLATGFGSKVWSPPATTPPPSDWT